MSQERGDVPMRLVVTPAQGPLRGVVPGPLDRDGATFAVALAALARGAESLLEGRGIPTLPLVSELAAMGVAVEPVLDDHGRRIALRVSGVGMAGLRAPGRPLDAGSCRATMAVLAAIGVSLPFATQLLGDPASIRATLAPLARILRQRGATIEGRFARPDSTVGPHRVGALEPPVELGPTDVPLSPLSCEIGGLDEDPGMRALVKATALLSGLEAEGTTQLFERIVGEDMVPRMLGAAGLDLRSLGPVTELDGPVRLRSLRGELPVDPSLAAGLLALGLQSPDSQVGVRRTPTRPSARGWLEALGDAGARLHAEPKHDALGQPASDVVLRHGLERPLMLGGERASRVGIALPILVTLALRAPAGSRSQLFDLVRDDDPEVAATLRLLRAFGASATAREGGLEVEGIGARALRGTAFDAGGDAMLAFAATLLAARSDGPCEIGGADALLARFPRLAATLRAVGLDIVVTDGGPSPDRLDASTAPTSSPSL